MLWVSLGCRLLSRIMAYYTLTKTPIVGKSYLLPSPESPQKVTTNHTDLGYKEEGGDRGKGRKGNKEEEEEEEGEGKITRGKDNDEGQLLHTLQRKNPKH